MATGGEWTKTTLKPKDWDNIELICSNNFDELFYDIMFAYDGENRSNRILVLGYWNGGVVEQQRTFKKMYK